MKIHRLIKRKNFKNSTKHFLVLIVLVCFGGWVKTNAQSDPFLPYLKTVPNVIKVLSCLNYGTGDSAITVKKFTIGTRDDLDTVYAIMAYPKNLQGKHPGLVFLHGGGSKAEDLFYLIQVAI
ncbi:hypothetical protein A9P82_12120 [Arachidicoccus ginsenosidimutans]|uniref:hypothetical protein n=1 Tax=Arachidicoccus sp. BS20 TaxID=1850526 RepID=UPI0007F0DB66|nr:hypothetical protein [Arachidicoccus sp. BS20]ANI89965.1 hypothetical protein A9P82_12120 [Arachidicoccus sp. BS20]